MFYAYYRPDTGQLLSVGTQFRDDADLAKLSTQKGFTVARKDYAERPINGWDVAAMDFTVLPPPPRADASTLFLRMTLNEHAQIIALARQNTAQGYRAQAWMDRMKHRATFTKDDTELVQGMTLLVQEGIFTQARAAEILGWS